MFHESLVAPVSDVTDVAGTSASARYVECGPKLVRLEGPRPKRTLIAWAGAIRSLNRTCAFSTLTSPCVEATSSAKNVVLSLKLPPAQRWASAMVYAPTTEAPLSALPPLESLTGWKTVSPLNPRASGTWAGRVAVSPEVLLRSVIA